MDLTYFIPCSTSTPSEHVRKIYGFLKFSGGVGMEHWREIALTRKKIQIKNNFESCFKIVLRYCYKL